MIPPGLEGRPEYAEGWGYCEGVGDLQSEITGLCLTESGPD